jgi:hypothetical protein
MIIDRYTKIVLTIIAGCLLWICAMGAGSSVAAQPSTLDMSALKGTVPVIIVGTGTMDRTGKVAIQFTGPGAQRTDPTIPVTLPYSTAKPLPVGLPYTSMNPMPSQLFYTPHAPLPVEIAAVRKTGEWEPIRARVEDAPVRTKPGGGGDRR